MKKISISWKIAKGINSSTEKNKYFIDRIMKLVKRQQNIV